MLSRKVFCSQSCWIRILHQSATTPSSTKSNLAKLRKKTGFTFANCKKALVKFDNDLAKAEKWLREEAQREGWTKATKLQGRTTADGLIGVMAHGHLATMVEVNCETDFVARNDKFQKFVGQVTQTAFKNLQKTVPSTQEIMKQSLSSEEMKKIIGEDGKSLEDLTALSIGQIGENMSLKRTVNIAVPEDLVIGSYVHSSAKPHLGKYGALIVFKRTGKSTTGLSLSELGRRLGQHIVGMNPLRIGVYVPPTPEEIEAKRLKIEELKARAKAEVEEEDGEEEVSRPPEPVEEEKVIEDMMMQEYLFDPAITVGEMLLMEKTQVVEFARFALGEAEHE